MLRELVNKLFRAKEVFPDGASVFYGQRESIRYEDGKKRYIEFDIEYDGKTFIVIGKSPHWKGELSGKVDSSDLSQIMDRIRQYFKNRGMHVELR